MTKGLKERRMRSFQWAMEIKWFDFRGYHELPDGRMVKITLQKSITRGEYNGISVTLFNPQVAGAIDAKIFLFADYLTPEDTDRPMSMASIRSEMRISQNIDFRWVLVPESTRPICEAIEEWIDMYREPTEEDADVVRGK